MGQYVLRRLLLMIPTFFIILTVVFILINVVPGDRLALIFQEGAISKDDVERATKELGLDKPLHQQYGIFLGKIARGDLGYSLRHRSDVWDLIKQRAPNSIRLGIMALLVAWTIAIPIGVMSAVKQDKAFDYGARSLAVAMLAIPNFWLALMVILVPAITLGIFVAPPYVPFGTDPWGNIKFFFVPAIVLGVQLTGATMRMTRATMLEVLRADFIRTARAKGLDERSVIIRHALKNSLIPVITILGNQSALIIGGTVIIEQIFSIPGIGQLTVNSVLSKDVPVVTGVIVVLASFVLLMNLLVDLTYGWLDPRISYK